MPYRGNNYSFVIDSSFQPFSMQEMLVPFTAYKEAFEKSEEAYNDLKDKADVFKDLSRNLPEGSEARKIYEGYANDLNAQAADLANNGLTMGNRRALTGLKQRYQGEIGVLAKAQTALEKEKELRRQMSAKDPTMLYAISPEELNIDKFLYGNTPSQYGISGTELYTKAAAASQAASKRQFSVNGESKTMGDYYYDYVQRMGYNPETIAKFRQDMSAIPELQQAAEDILAANGVIDNLSGRALEQARQQVINGLIDGAVYTEAHTQQRNLGKQTAAEIASAKREDARLAESKRQHDLSMKIAGYDPVTGEYSEDRDQSIRQYIARDIHKNYQHEADGSIKKDNNGNPVKNTSSTSATRTSRPKVADMIFTPDGTMYEAKDRSDTSSNGNKDVGKPISYTEATQACPSIKNVIPIENADMYLWTIDSDGNVHNIAYTTNSSNNTSTSPQIGGAPKINPDADDNNDAL